MLSKHRIKHIDVGGWTPVEGYLTLHLSPIEIYGLPTLPRETMPQVVDDCLGIPCLKRRNLDSVAVSLNYDVTFGFPLADNSLHGANLSHFLEHFDLNMGRWILRECRRVIQPGGILRISCPDLKKYASAYLTSDREFFARVDSQPFCAYAALPTHGAIVAAKAYDASNGHKWFYDAETVITLLREVGFDDAQERHLHESALPHIRDVEPSCREIESFYVEASR